MDFLNGLKNTDGEQVDDALKQFITLVSYFC